MLTTFTHSPRLALAAALCTLLTIIVGMSIVPAIAGQDAPTIVRQMPGGNCPPSC